MRSVEIDNALNVDLAALCFRSATFADVAPIVILVDSAYRGDASPRSWTNEASLLNGRRTDQESVCALIEAAQSVIVLAEWAGEIIGCAHIKQRGDLCQFGMFAVWPGLQGAGIGGVVLSECERLARESWGCRAMELLVIRQRDDLVAWYERRNYRRTGEARPFPYGDARFRPRRPDLEFIVLKKPLRAGDIAEVMAYHDGAISC